ncbi:hypothetical protein AaE_013751 [Aphanomyces astaci]|uniref:L-seryl-tRNA(Sec) kinase n=1 Tax=Aphanomyces astaci TaxID=112090 RepID=A0A6A4Z3Y8_APHAT|nr:hypothetical protein AaE_013751 [Aphanomyces astaci]
MATSTAVVLVLCGLPGAGKSSFCRALASHCQSNDTMSIEWICYDDIFDDSRGHDNEKFDPSTWRDLRMAVVDRVQSSLRSLAVNAVGKPLLVFLLDDNMYYRSMRKRFHQLAQICAQYTTSGLVKCPSPHPTPFAVVAIKIGWFQCPRRSLHVWRLFWKCQMPAAILGSPIPFKCPWIPMRKGTDDAVTRTMDFVSYVAQHPESSPPPSDTPEKEASRESNRRNVVHCLDTRLRRLVGSILHEETTQAKAVRAKELNAAKDFILDRCRTETKHDQTEDVAATVDDFAMAFLHLVDI